jgi:hypothetical protein
VGGSQAAYPSSTPPGLLRTYAALARRASGRCGQVLDDQGGRLVGVVVADAEHAQRPLAGQRDLVALPPVERRAPEGGRLGGQGHIVLHYNPTAGGTVFGGMAVCGAHKCSNVIVRSDLVPPVGVTYTAQYLYYVTMHELGMSSATRSVSGMPSR